MKKILIAACFILSTFGIKAYENIESFIIPYDIKCSNNLNKSNQQQDTIKEYEDYIRDNIKIEINMDQNKYIQGELIEATALIKNIGGKNITLYQGQFQNILLHLQKNQAIQSSIGNMSGLPINIEANKEIIMPLHLTGLIKYNEFDLRIPGLPWFYWYEGDYQYRLEITDEYQHAIVNSNTSGISVLPVPDSLKQAFENLKYDTNNLDKIDKTTYVVEKNEKLFERYKESFYAKEYYFKLLSGFNYTDAILDNIPSAELKERAKQLYSEYILKFPDSFFARDCFPYLYRRFDENKELLQSILKQLREAEMSESMLQRYIKNDDYGGFQKIKKLVK